MNTKDFFLYLILGLVQGLVEPLPISSSGHMIIFEYFLKINFSNLNFKIFVNFASLLAIIFYYRKFIFSLIKDFFSYIFIKNKRKETKKNFLYVIYIVIACIPSAIVGILFKDFVDLYLSNILTVSLSLLFTCIILFIISKNKNKNSEEMNIKKSLKIGASQVIGLIPGISRSGITTFFAINNNISIEDALKFSFLMYIPTSFGATLLSILDTSFIITSFNPLYIVSFLASLVSTYLALIFFFKLVKKKNFKIFAIYLLILSIILLFII